LSQERGLIKDAFFFNGRHYSQKEIVEEFKNISDKILHDINSLPQTVTYKSPGNAAALDNISIAEYIHSLNCSSWMKSLLDMVCTTEYGTDSSEQSLLNFLYLDLPRQPQEEFNIYGSSDERYKISGGNQQLTDALAANLKENIELEQKL